MYREEREAAFRQVPVFYEFKQTRLNLTKKTATFCLIFLTANLQAQNLGRELVFSADLCYNGANKKPLPLGEVAA